MIVKCNLGDEYAWFDLPGSQGWVYYNWSLENDVSLFGETVKRKSPGYLRQEYLKIIATVRPGKTKQKHG